MTPQPTGARVASTLHLLIESMVRGLGPRVTPELKQQLREGGLDLDRLPKALPLSEWLVHRRRLAALAFPEESPREALRLLGLHFLRGWRMTATGAALSRVLSLLGPARSLTRLERAFRTTDPATSTTVELVGRDTALITFDDVHGDAPYWQGLIESGLELLRREGEVTIVAETPPGAILRVTWR